MEWLLAPRPASLISSSLASLIPQFGLARRWEPLVIRDQGREHRSQLTWPEAKVLQ